MGADLDSLNAIAQRIEAVVRFLPGTRSAYAARVTGGCIGSARIGHGRAFS